MKICNVHISGLSPYSSSRAHEAEKLKGETANDYEERTWPQKSHIKDGKVFIPPMGFKLSVDRAVKISGKQIPGKGKATYTKFFEAGSIVTDPVFVANEADIGCERVHANADGVRGSGKRVWRKFPRLDQWSGIVCFNIIAAEITKDVFEEAVTYAGLAVGVGRFRPEKGGYFGRFKVDRFEWS